MLQHVFICFMICFLFCLFYLFEANSYLINCFAFVQTKLQDALKLQLKVLNFQLKGKNKSISGVTFSHSYIQLCTQKVNAFNGKYLKEKRKKNGSSEF